MPSTACDRRPESVHRSFSTLESFPVLGDTRCGPICSSSQHKASPILHQGRLGSEFLWGLISDLAFLPVLLDKDGNNVHTIVVAIFGCAKHDFRCSFMLQGFYIHLTQYKNLKKSQDSMAASPSRISRPVMKILLNARKHSLRSSFEFKWCHFLRQVE